MSAPSPTPSTNALLSVSVTVDGAALDDSYAIESVNVTHAINRISVAELVLRGSDIPGSGTFAISDGDTFKPGAAVVVLAGYDNVTHSIFSGIVMKHAVEMNNAGSKLRVTCKHKAVHMTFRAAEETYSEKKDSDVLSAIIGTYGLSATVTATTESYPFVFQRVATDWDFMLSRAEYNGHVVTLGDGKVVVGPPQVSSSAVLRLSPSESIFSFSAELNVEDQPTAVSAHAWDAKTQASISATAAEPSVNTQGNSSSSILSSGQKELKMITSTPMTSGDLKIWADGILLRKRLGALKGTIKFVGSHLVKPDTIVEIADVGARFNGNAYVSSVQHKLESAKWVTSIRIGLDDTPIYEQQGFSYPAAGGQLPSIHGLQLGTVKKLSGDPAGETRLQITVPSNAGTEANVWARFGNFYGSNGFGAGFVPEVGDEVVVGFIDGDPRYPVILGSLYSSGRTSPNAPADENNYIKSITTKSKLKISFDDEKKVVKIETPGGNSVTISDEDKGIELKDQNSNSVKLSDSGIVINSAKDITIKATGAINLTANGKVSVKATQDLALAGMNVNATAQMGATVKGSATAEISASGQTTVKGGIVMIN